MAIERETVIEVVVSFLAVGGFIAAVAWVGMTYGDGGLSEQGALVLVALMAGFVLAMSVVGYWLSGREA